MPRLNDKLRLPRVGPELHVPSLPSLPRLRGDVRLPKISARSTATGLVGLEIEADSVAVAEVCGNAELVTTAVAPLPAGAFADGEVVEADAIAAVLRALWREHQLSKRVRLGVANQRVVVRTMRLPAIEDPKQLEAAVRFQAEEQIPMPVEQAILDHRLVGSSASDEDGPATVDVVVTAARREMISAALKPLRDAGLEPVGVDLSAFGLIRALADRETGEEGDPTTTVLYCNVGDATNLAIARGRACVFTRVSPTGLDRTGKALQEKAGLTAEHARLWLTYVGLSTPLDSIDGDPALAEAARSAVESGAAELLDELRLSIDFFGAQEGAMPVEQVVLGGPGATIPGLAEHLEAGLRLPIASRTPDALAALDPLTATRLTLPYGLALGE